MTKTSDTRCGLLELYAFLGRKWAFGLFTLIDDRPRSYNELDDITKKLISPSLLSARLKEMVALGMIRKEKVAKKIIYTQTPEGKKLKSILHDLKRWSLSAGYHIPTKCRKGQCVCHDSFIKIQKDRR